MGRRRGSRFAAKADGKAGPIGGAEAKNLPPSFSWIRAVGTEKQTPAGSEKFRATLKRGVVGAPGFVDLGRLRLGRKDTFAVQIETRAQGLAARGKSRTALRAVLSGRIFVVKPRRF